MQALRGPQLGSQSPLQGDRLLSTMHGDGGVGVVARRVRIRDLAEEFRALDDVQSHAIVGRWEDAEDHVVFVIDEDVCTRCGLCVDRCPTGVIIMGKAGVAPRTGDAHQRDNKHGYSYGMRW